MAKASKNKSRQLDIVETPAYIAEVNRLRSYYRSNFEAFCEDKLKIVDKTADGNPMIPFRWNQCQKTLMRLVEKIGDFNEIRTTKLHDRDGRQKITRLPIEIVVLKARKVGISTLIEARAFWRAALYKEQKILVMAHERPAAQNIADISQRFDTYWDVTQENPIIKLELVRSSDDLLEWTRGHGSSIVVETAGTKGGGSSRSFTYHMVHMSEAAFYPADSPQVSSALKARAPYHESYFESTANGVGNMFHDDWENAMYVEDVVKLWESNEATPKWWNGKYRFFWPWFAQDENRVSLFEHERQYISDTLDDAEAALVQDFDIELEQIAWRRAQITGPCSKQTMMSPESFFRQEEPSTPDEAFIARSEAIFDTKKLNDMATAAKTMKPTFLGFLTYNPDDPLGFKLMKGGQYIAPEHGHAIIEGAQFVQWEPPKAESAYILGADSAEGLEHGDWSVISIWDRSNGSVLTEVCRLRAKTPARELGEIANFLGLMYNEAYIVAERNPPGNAMCERLIELNYPNMYHHRNIETVTNHDNPEAFTAGFKTTGSTKPMICERGIEAIRDNEIVIRHPDALREWKMFTRVDKKYGAPEGQNDDCVIADLLAFFGTTEAPPLDMRNVTKIEEPKETLTLEQRQNLYWKERMTVVRDRCARENTRRAEQIMHSVRKYHFLNEL